MRSAAAIQADLTAAYAARAKVLARGVTEGHDGASVTRATLAELRDTIAELNDELAIANGGGGLSFTPTIGVGS
jgi:hypothetical protein